MLVGKGNRDFLIIIWGGVVFYLEFYIVGCERGYYIFRGFILSCFIIWIRGMIC